MISIPIRARLRALATLGGAAALAVMLGLGGCGGEAEVGRPWEVTRLPQGGTEVLGLRPGQSRMTEALARFGKRVDAALFNTAGEEPVVEAYYSSVNAAGITGRLILTLSLPEHVMEGLQERSPEVDRLRTGTMRYTLNIEDSEMLLGAPIRAVTFVPSVRLDEEVIQARFGEPAERMRTEAGESHLLYPEMGLDIVLPLRGKPLLQYVHPQDFGWLRAQIPA
jgi:hypothetical protein